MLKGGITIITKYGLDCVSLESYKPNFLNAVSNYSIFWRKVDYIYPRIKSFLLWIADISFKEFECYCCTYPHSTTTDFIVFVDVDNGRKMLLLSTTCDDNLHYNSWKFVAVLKDELLLLDTSRENMSLIRQEMLCQLHLNG